MANYKHRLFKQYKMSLIPFRTYNIYKKTISPGELKKLSRITMLKNSMIVIASNIKKKLENYKFILFKY